MLPSAVHKTGQNPKAAMGRTLPPTIPSAAAKTRDFLGTHMFTSTHVFTKEKGCRAGR